jgi:hypothetical protein
LLDTPGYGSKVQPVRPLIDFSNRKKNNNNNHTDNDNDNDDDDNL